MATSEPLIRVMALHALCYCERLFYLEEVEEIRLTDDAMYAGRTLHAELEATEEDNGEWRVIELADESLGLIGKVDCLKRRNGSLIPYEHKRGRPRRENSIAAAWWPDAVQVSAYAMLLERLIKRPVPEGRIRYHATNVTVRVPLDEQMRQAVINAVKRARQLRTSTERPPVTSDDRLCLRCSLAPVCLPEEERVAAASEWQAVRLFPADSGRKTVHVNEPGTTISRAGNTIKIHLEGTEDRIFPIHELGALVLHGYVQISTQALHFCVHHDIAVHWLSAGGRYVGSVSPEPRGVQRKIRQYRALSVEATCLELARKLTTAKVDGYLRYLLRATRRKDRESMGITKALNAIRQALRGIAQAENADSIRGYEGTAARAWFDVLPALFTERVAAAMRPCGRSRRPPLDRFNALLSFGYALLYQAVLQAVQVVGLEPSLGFYHTPRSSAHPLVLDLMELFRLVLWDIPLIGSVNRQQWNLEHDFECPNNRVWLTAAGRKKAITLFEKRLVDAWRHPVVGYSLSYRRLIELEVRLLEKEWSGQPGLFARMRLR